MAKKEKDRVELKRAGGSSKYKSNLTKTVGSESVNRVVCGHLDSVSKTVRQLDSLYPKYLDSVSCAFKGLDKFHGFDFVKVVSDLAKFPGSDLVEEVRCLDRSLASMRSNLESINKNFNSPSIRRLLKEMSKRSEEMSKLSKSYDPFSRTRL